MIVLTFCYIVSMCLLSDGIMCIDKWRSALFGRVVGEDSFGNIYYESKGASFFGRKKRWVIYPNKERDSTTIPALWHMWLHCSCNHVPLHEDVSNHVKNRSGTDDAYVPLSLLLNGSGRSFYKGWDPISIRQNRDN